MVGGAMVGGTMASRAVVSRAVGSQQSRRNPSPSPSPSPNPNLNPNPEHTSAAIHMQLARIAASTQLLNHLRWRCGQGVSGGGRGSGDGAGTAGEGGGSGGGLAAAAAAGTAWLGTVVVKRMPALSARAIHQRLLGFRRLGYTADAYRSSGNVNCIDFVKNAFFRLGHALPLSNELLEHTSRLYSWLVEIRQRIQLPHCQMQ